jgi:molybdate transport system substrate-binding protein
MHSVCGQLKARLLIGVFFLLPGWLQAESINVAVASNFRPAMLSLQQTFESASKHHINLIFGSTGKQYAQIKQGAPFDVFLAADTERPRLIEADGLAVNGNRFTYAIGQLVLWSAEDQFVDHDGKVLHQNDYQHLSIANPRLAPYGLAAQQTLQALGVWETVEKKLVYGENVSQAYQFIASGNARLGFVALSQVLATQEPANGSHWVVPKSLYEPIAQQGVLLSDNEASRSFFSFLHSEQAIKIIQQHGYETP